jgi:protein-S-isoprenylcysteine O-methyltransferase Ste14
MTEEEKRSIEKFGDAYRRYMQKVPRINLIAGITKQIHYKKKSS